jgi:hypothetical protein
LALAGNFLIALFISRFLAIARKNIEQCRDGNPGQSQGWFKPYSISLRKKGAGETVRHFCAQARPRRFDGLAARADRRQMGYAGLWPECARRSQFGRIC